MNRNCLLTRICEVFMPLIPNEREHVNFCTLQVSVDCLTSLNLSHKLVMPTKFLAERH